MSLQDILGTRTVIFDGGLGTLLQARGLQPGESPALWSLTHKDVLLDVPEAYLRAGCDVVTTNTFGANRLLLPADVSVQAVVKASVDIAREAVRNLGHGIVALDIGPSGRLLAPYGDLMFEDAVSVFGEAIQAGAEAGADFVLIETMTDCYEVKAAVLAAKEYAKLPIIVSMMFDGEGKLLTGADVRGMVAMLEGLGVDAIGCNCGFGPSQLKVIAAQMLEAASIPVLVLPNAGLPEIIDGETRFLLSPEDFAEVTAQIADMGAWMVGGCCGTTPEHIAALKRACVSISPKPISNKNTCIISSWGRSVSLDDHVAIIGERLNPTGKKKLKQALRDRDVDYVLREALLQQAQGAQVLDLNVGMPELNEAELYADLLPRIQAVTELPIQIDSSNMDAMETALRLYNGKPLINSVCGKQESMDAVFPLVKRYGGVVVALALDESGIPESVEGRLQIVKNIYAEAQKYGIDRKNIIVDVLTLPVSVQPTAAMVTLEALRQVRQTLNGRTILGVSNVSHGLPRRPELNAAFLSMAIYEGLNAAIMNPGSVEMMQALHAAGAITGRDDHFGRYLACQGAPEGQKPTISGVPTLEEAVQGGLAKAASQAALALLKTETAESIIANTLMPALDSVARRYETGEIYLPQLLQTTDAAKAAFDALNLSDIASKDAPGVLLATVYGDVHDIGKNIIKVLLQNYGFKVVDLGKNVPSDQIVHAAREQQIKLIGLSALMTTTVHNMQDAIQRIHEQLPDVHVMVGGAVLTESLARQIGADSYGRDAMAAVTIAQSFLGEAR